MRERRNTHPYRKTYSAYVDSRVIAVLDTLVKDGVYPNRSEAIEDACRLLVTVKAPEIEIAEPVAA